MNDQKIIRALKQGAYLERDYNDWGAPLHLFSKDGDKIKHQVSPRLILRLKQQRKIVLKRKQWTKWVWHCGGKL